MNTSFLVQRLMKYRHSQTWYASRLDTRNSKQRLSVDPHVEVL
jgi:hypothetical protein